MNTKYLFLGIDLLSILIPFALSFYPKAPFYKKWKYLWITILIPAVIFILWAELFTQLGVWGFNPNYVSGYYLLSLPIEEVLFFICVPYACVFTYFALNHFIEKDYLFPHQELISSALAIAMLIIGIYHIEQWYTGVTFISLGLFLAFQMLKLRPRYMGRFYVAFAGIIPPFLIVNGILTGSFIDTEVVWYNKAEQLGMKIGTIPIEDVFYGMLLMVLNISLFEWLQNRESR